MRVTIYYCEPTYASKRGIPEREYRGTFEVSAHTEDEAVRLAIAQFRAAAQVSSVGWERRITRISCGESVELRPTADGQRTDSVEPTTPTDAPPPDSHHPVAPKGPIESALAESIASALAQQLRGAVAEVLTELLEAERARPALLSQARLARELDVSITSVDRMLERGELPEPIMVDDSPRWAWAEVQQWLSRRPR